MKKIGIILFTMVILSGCSFIEGENGTEQYAEAQRLNILMT